MPFLSDCIFVEPGLLRGHVRLEGQPGRHWHVGLSVNGQFLGATLADLPGGTTEVAAQGHGFHFSLNPAALDERDELRLEVLNTSHVIADCRLSDLRAQGVPDMIAPGRLDYGYGLTISGTVENGVTDLPSYEILAMEGEAIVGRCRVNRWQHIGKPQDPRGRAAAFDLHIDPALADGRFHRLHIETSTGAVLAGSPVDIIAWPSALPQAPAVRDDCTPAEALRTDLVLGRLMGSSMPLPAYAGLYPELFAARPVLPDGHIGEDGHWHRLADTGWALCHHRDIHPLPGLSDRLRNVDLASARAVFCDLAVEQADGSLWPLLFSAFDWERLLEQGHAALCFALPESALAAPGASEAASLIDLLLRWLSPDGAAPAYGNLWHLPHPGGRVPEAALHGSTGERAQALRAALQRPGLFAAGSRITPGQREGAIFPALHLQRPISDRAVSVIIPTRNQGQMLKVAVGGLIEANPGFDLDVIVVDNGTDEPDSLSVLNELEDRGIRILEYSDGFNFSLINNLACEHARHGQLCFMNNDVAFPQPGVLAELCSRLACPSVGASGPLMLRASDIIQHGGVILGPWHGAVHAFEDRMAGDPGYAELLRVASEPAAVTGALLLTRRALFERMGGFDTTRFAVNFNDVDYCLRLREAGYRIVFTPHAMIRHYESVSRGREIGTPADHRRQREIACLRDGWRGAILNDPQYHPLFAVDSLPYRALALDHRDPAPRRAGLPPQSAPPLWA
jgi:GT2 family glycosyltransferase